MSCLTPELRRDNQFVSNTGNNFDLYAAFFDLFAQMRYVDIHRAGLTIEIETPGFLQNLLAAEDESAVLGAVEEQVKFLATQVQCPRSEADFPSGRVDGQVS